MKNKQISSEKISGNTLLKIREKFLDFKASIASIYKKADLSHDEETSEVSRLVNGKCIYKSLQINKLSELANELENTKNVKKDFESVCNSICDTVNTDKTELAL